MLACFIQNVLRSTHLHANKTTKKCIQFLNKTKISFYFSYKNIRIPRGKVSIVDVQHMTLQI